MSCWQDIEHNSGDVVCSMNATAAQQRADILNASLVTAQDAATKAISKFAAVKDKTKWLDLAPVSDPVTLGYVQSTKDLVPLAAARALYGASSETQRRGTLYPFVVGDFKTNGLLQAVEWLCDAHSAIVCSQGVCAAAQASEFAHVGSPTWNALKAKSVLDTISTTGSYQSATLAAAHAARANNEPFQEACLQLARLSFILRLSTVPHRPSLEMEDDIWNVVQNKPARTTELAELVPKIVKSDIAQHIIPDVKHSDEVWDRLHGLCSLRRLPDTLKFDV